MVDGDAKGGHIVLEPTTKHSVTLSGGTGAAREGRVHYVKNQQLYL